MACDECFKKTQGLGRRPGLAKENELVRIYVRAPNASTDVNLSLEVSDREACACRYPGLVLKLGRELQRGR